VRFKDKVAIITGAGKGIGKAVALDFAKEGAKTVICSRTEKDLIAVADEIKKMGADCLYIKADISIEEDVKNVINKALEKFKTIDVLVNNAAIQYRNKVVETPLSEWEKTLKVNLTGTFLFCREALKTMIKNNYGKIINISSDAGKIGFADIGAYSASKFGVMGLTETIAREVADYNINANTICLSNVDTPLHRSLCPDLDYSKIKIMRPEEVSRVVLFMSSDDSKIIKGESIKTYDGQDFASDYIQ